MGRISKWIQRSELAYNTNVNRMHQYISFEDYRKTIQVSDTNRKIKASNRNKIEYQKMS